MIWLVFTEVAARLATQVPKLKTVTWYSGQLESPELNNQVVLPSAFIRFQPIRWRDQQRGVQVGDINFDVVVVDRYSGDFRHGQAAQEAALESVKLLDDIHQALHGWGSTWFQKCTRTETSLDHAPGGGWIAHSVSYQTVLTDACADLLGPKVVANPAYAVEADSDPEGPANAAVD